MIMRLKEALPVELEYYIRWSIVVLSLKGLWKNGLSIFWCPIPVWGGEMAEPLRFT